MTFTHLHTHSRASILKSSIDVDALVARAKELNMGAIALTDYNNLFNIIPFYKTCHQNNIKPILGIELNITNDCAESIQLKIKDTSSIVLLAENNAGWRNIIKLHNIANDNEHFYYTPRIDLNLLEQYREGVIVLTGSNNGIINSLLTIDVNGHISNDFKASAMIRRLLTFLDKDHLYIEVQDFNNTNTLELNKKLRQLALKYGLSTVATNDIHYLHKADAEAHKTLRTMSEFQHAKISGSTFETDEYYLKSRKEMETNEFSDIKGSDLFCSELDITNTIAERCNVSIDLKRNRLPSYPYTPAGKTGIQFLREKVFSNPMKWTQEYLNRAEKELVDIRLNSGHESFEELQKLSNRIGEIAELLDKKEMRWLELSELVV